MGPTSAWIFRHLVFFLKRELTINFFEPERKVGKKNWGEETVFQFF